MEKNLKVIGISGLARAGKDLYYKIASKLLNDVGYETKKYAFADALKNDLDDWLKRNYGISAWTDNTEEKKIIRPFMVAHGCGKRIQTEGKYWVEKIDWELKVQQDMVNNGYRTNNVIHFITDVRFPNEADWVHDGWNGKLIHLRRFSFRQLGDGNGNIFVDKVYDPAPNEEEEKNDPLVKDKSDFKLEWENMLVSKKSNSYEELLENEELKSKVKESLIEFKLTTST